MNVRCRAFGSADRHDFLLATHNMNGLLLAYGLTLIALLAAFIQRGVAWRALCVAPFFAIPVALAGAVAGEALSAVLPTTAASATWAATIIRIGAVLFVGYATGLFLSRRRDTQDEHKRGTMLIPFQRPKVATPGRITLAGVEIPPLDETKHFKLIGATGSGKSTAIRESLTSALQRGDRAIIADPDGGYLARFYRPERGDMILNPFDQRSARWDLFGEIEQPYDVDQLARSLIPEGPDPSGHEWRGFARSFLSAVIEYARSKKGQIWPSSTGCSSSLRSTSCRASWPAPPRSHYWPVATAGCFAQRAGPRHRFSTLSNTPRAPPARRCPSGNGFGRAGECSFCRIKPARLPP